MRLAEAPLYDRVSWLSRTSLVIDGCSTKSRGIEIPIDIGDGPLISPTTTHLERGGEGPLSGVMFLTQATSSE